MNENKFFAGGYYIISETKRKNYMSEELINDRVITVSNCICEHSIGEWTIRWWSDHKRINYFKELLSLSSEKVDEFLDDIEELYNIKKFGFPGVFTDLESARFIYKKYLNHLEGFKLIGIGLREDEYRTYCDLEDIEKNNEHYGINICFSNKKILDKTNILGYDILGYEFGYFHSYLCNGLEKDIYRKLKVKPNKKGLFNNYNSAKLATDYISDESIGAEPALWQPWIICEYSF